MPFQKGRSGNPRGRPKRGYSLAEMIRARLKGQGLHQMLEQMLALAAKPHDDPHARIKAAEFFAKHGWPEEAKGLLDGLPGSGELTVRWKS